MPKLTVLRGLPGSGKSTLSQKMMDENPKLRRINKDMMRQMSNQGKFSPKDENALNATLYFMTEAFLLSGFDVVSDNMNLADQHTHAFAQIIDSIHARTDLKIEMEVIDLDVALETCIERVVARNLESHWESRNMVIEPETVRSIYDQWFKDGIFPALTVKRDYLVHKVGI